MEAGSVSESAYANYGDLLEQAAGTNATPDEAQFAVVGSTSSIGFGDRYYAGIAPVNEMTSDYTIVVHMSGALNETQIAGFPDHVRGCGTGSSAWTRSSPGSPATT